MNCRDTRDALRRPGPVPPEALRHAAGCARCSLEARARTLLRLGSEVADDAAPRPGFEQRLAARLRDEQVAPERAGRAAGRAAVNGGFETLVRPALATAALLVLLCGGLYVSAPRADDDLAALAGADSFETSMDAFGTTP